MSARPSIRRLLFPLLLMGNRILENVAPFGGGASLIASTGVTFANDMIAGNRAGDRGRGAGIYVERSREAQLVHVTIADNSGGDGSGLCVANPAANPPDGQVAATYPIKRGTSRAAPIRRRWRCLG